MDVPFVRFSFFTTALPFDDGVFATSLGTDFLALIFWGFCLEDRFLLGFGKRIVVELDCLLGFGRRRIVELWGTEEATVVCPFLIVNRSLNPGLGTFVLAREVALHKRASVIVGLGTGVPILTNTHLLAGWLARRIFTGTCFCGRAFRFLGLLVAKPVEEEEPPSVACDSREAPPLP